MCRIGLAMLVTMMMCRASKAGEWDEVRTPGQGVVKVAPDMATFEVGVFSNSKSAADASVQTNLKAQKVIAALKDLGLKPNEYRTADVSVTSNYDYKTDTWTGYTASNTIVVTVCDLLKAGEILDKVVEAGGTRVSSLNMSVKDMKPHLAKARALAVKDAKNRADTLAAAAGATVGKPKRIEEDAGRYYRPGVYYATDSVRSGSGSTPVEPGLISITVNVSTTWELVIPEKK